MNGCRGEYHACSPVTFLRAYRAQHESKAPASELITPSKVLHPRLPGSKQQVVTATLKHTERSVLPTIEGKKSTERAGSKARRHIGPSALVTGRMCEAHSHWTYKEKARADARAALPRKCAPRALEHAFLRACVTSKATPQRKAWRDAAACASFSHATPRHASPSHACSTKVLREVAAGEKMSEKRCTHKRNPTTKKQAAWCISRHSVLLPTHSTTRRCVKQCGKHGLRWQSNKKHFLRQRCSRHRSCQALARRRTTQNGLAVRRGRGKSLSQYTSVQEQAGSFSPFASRPSRGYIVHDSP